MAPTLSVLALATAPIALAGCSDPDEDEVVTPVPDCSVPAENAAVLNLMKSVYLWYPEIPDVDTAAYASPDELLDAIVYKKIDRWSYVSSKSENDAYYNEGIQVGLGVRMRVAADDSVRLGLVYEGSPAGEAGLVRGDKVLALNGKTIAEIDAGDLWDTILGENKEGVEVSMTIEDKGGSARDLTVVKRPFKLTTAPVHKVIEDGDRVIGYLFFDRFIGPSIGELTAAFQSFKESKVNELILDLRYNGGGYVDVALKLGEMIGGARTEGDVFNKLVYNDKHPNWNKDQVFEDREEALDLARVVIVTTSSTASASELLINGLRPFVSVTLIGDTTYGKPVGMGSWPICDLLAHPISFRNVNANGQGDFYDGIEPDCPAGDDLTATLGDEKEASLAEALHFIHYGVCSMSAAPPAPSAPENAAARAPRSSREIPLRGFLGELGSY